MSLGKYFKSQVTVDLNQWLTTKIRHTTQRDYFGNVVTKHSWVEPIMNSSQLINKAMWYYRGLMTFKSVKIYYTAVISAPHKGPIRFEVLQYHVLLYRSIF